MYLMDIAISSISSLVIDVILFYFWGVMSRLIKRVKIPSFTRDSIILILTLKLWLLGGLGPTSLFLFFISLI